jgi:hypothetical protein
MEVKKMLANIGRAIIVAVLVGCYLIDVFSVSNLKEIENYLNRIDFYYKFIVVLALMVFIITMFPKITFSKIKKEVYWFFIIFIGVSLLCFSIIPYFIIRDFVNNEETFKAVIIIYIIFVFFIKLILHFISIITDLIIDCYYWLVEKKRLLKTWTILI